MARKRSEQLTHGEQKIMEVLWERGECSVKEIAATHSKGKSPAYTTIQTMCRILVDKGYAEFRQEGRAFVYSAKITKTEARRGAFRTMLNRFFGSSPELLAQHLIQETDVELSDLEALQKKIDKSE